MVVKGKFDIQTIKNILLSENKFATNLFSILPIPVSALVNEPSVVNEKDEKNNASAKPFLKNGTRAKSLEELQDRLKSIQSKKKLNYKDKLLKKGLKNRLKRKSKKEERNAKEKLVRTIKTSAPVLNEGEVKNQIKSNKPIFNSEGKMVFSKFDFTGLGGKSDKRNEKDPKKMLKTLEKHTLKLKELKEKGDSEKIIEVKEKYLWKNALAKAEGQKVKDDPLLLKKSIKKREQVKQKNQTKWKAREDNVKKGIEEKQKKRNENIAKKKKEKKVGKMKKAAKKGRIIPGF